MNISDIKRNIREKIATSWQNEKWVTNLSEFKGIEGKLYLLTINDLLMSLNSEQIIWMI